MEVLEAAMGEGSEKRENRRKNNKTRLSEDTGCKCGTLCTGRLAEDF
jgi:hypothetical protein